MGINHKPQPAEVTDDSSGPQRGTTYVVAVLEAQDQSYGAMLVEPEEPAALPEPEETKQLEGPVEEAA